MQTDVTGVNLTVRYDLALKLTALSISGRAGNAPAFTPGTLPNPAHPLTKGEETAVILVPDVLAGQTILLRVDGLAGKAIAGSAQQAVPLRRAMLVAADVTLGAPAVCGDRVVRADIEQCDDGNTASGDGCSADCQIEGSQGSCSSASCPGGCCRDGECEPRALATCGTAGALCTVCDPLRADTCSEAGCRCGGGAVCADGQVCVNGACACNDKSCRSGCCQGSVCVVPPSLAACGIDGARCTRCDETKANLCDANGACACGTGPACAGGQVCQGGLCVCNATSCPSGCCRGDVCATRSLVTCGNAGSTCAMCDARSDNCSAAGECRCGGRATCALGQRCLGGTCVCDGTSCPDGCCSGGACLPGDTDTSCGAGGNTCDVCPGAQTCTYGRCSGCNSNSCPDGCCSGASCNAPSLAACGTGSAICVGCDARRADGCSATGACSCGGGPECSVGSRCQNGVCICRSGSCPNGCCLSGSCIPPAVNLCGFAGGTCTVCDLVTADNCTTAGLCGCGSGPACGARQHCLAGICVCDETSCPNGCCFGNTCHTPVPATCGFKGATCLDCGSSADGCSSGGVCLCGGGPACPAGSRCLKGACVCDGTSCPTGCCAGTTCVMGVAADACGTGGAECQDCGADGTCTSGVCSTCTAANCQNGCCSGPTCTTTGSLSACGANGAACVPCDAARADHCSSTGICSCGDGAACGAGKSCVAGACVCDARSCPNGCCANGACQPAAAATCGIRGGTCASCAAPAADTCDVVTGACRCGMNPPCGAGTVCLSGSCVCNGQSCPGGCCASGACVSPPTTAACGTNGDTCVGCDATTADTCDAVTGACRCGVNAPCETGSHCASGSCAPDP